MYIIADVMQSDTLKQDVGLEPTNPRGTELNGVQLNVAPEVISLHVQCTSWFAYCSSIWFLCKPWMHRNSP